MRRCASDSPKTRNPTPYLINGTATWTPPADTSPYLDHRIWLLTRKEYSFSVDEIYFSGSQVDLVPLGTNSLTFSRSRDTETTFGYAQYIAVIPNRQDGDRTAAFNQADVVGLVDYVQSLGALQVESVAFTDSDSVATYVEGPVTWARQDTDYGFVEASAESSDVCFVGLNSAFCIARRSE